MHNWKTDKWGAKTRNVSTKERHKSETTLSTGSDGEGSVFKWKLFIDKRKEQLLKIL